VKGLLDPLRQAAAIGVALVRAAIGGRIVDQRAYWESRSLKSGDERESVEGDAYYEQLDAMVLDRLRRYGDGHRFFLEVGTYQGYRLSKLARALDRRSFVGVDLGFVNLAVGAGRLPRPANATVVNADACALPFRPGSADLVFTIVALTHVPPDRVALALREMVAVTARYVMLIEIDCRPMRWGKRLQAMGLSYGYMHRYEQLLDRRVARVIERVPIRDEHGDPRYTLFVFEKVA
jgi:ubiquinone/menaquinone biosynthesis C-methylase UbiE